MSNGITYYFHPDPSPRLPLSIQITYPSTSHHNLLSRSAADNEQEEHDIYVGTGERVISISIGVPRLRGWREGILFIFRAHATRGWASHSLPTRVRSSRPKVPLYSHTTVRRRGHYMLGYYDIIMPSFPPPGFVSGLVISYCPQQGYTFPLLSLTL